MLAAAAAAAALGGCAGGSQSALPSQSTSFYAVRRAQAAPSGPKVFVSDFGSNVVRIYPAGVASPSPIGSIDEGIAGPDGLAVDSKGTLYVTNSSNNTLTEYPAGVTSPSVTISNGLSTPTAVAVSTNGTVAVSEFPAGTIVEYKPGATSPSVTMTLLTYPEGLAWDSKGDLYAAWNVNNGNGLTGHVSKCEHLKAVCLDQGIAAGQSGGLAIDSAGNIVLGDQTNSAVNVYAPGKTSPLRTISVTGHDPAKFALNLSEKRLYVSDIENSIVVTYAYTSGKPGFVIQNSLTSATGVSLSPAAKNGP